MKSKILINAVDHDECRIAKVIDTKLEEFHIESSTREITYGNIYKGVITRIEPSLQAVFIDYGAERNGFLQKHEIHSDYYLDPPSGDRSIKHLVKRGQEMLVQVTKEPIMKKGAMLTTHISLPGRFTVLIPGNDTRGISRKIEDEKERRRLKEILNGLKIPDGYGLIVRTAGKRRTKTVINRDVRYLMRLWKTIKSNVMTVDSPSLMYKERDLVVRSLRDYFTPEVEEILIDDPDAHRKALNFMKIISPKHTKIVKLYKSVKPIFTKFQLEEQIESIYNSRVKLKSGGSIVIQQTEALVSIDVNSGKATREDSIEQTALNTNLEAAEEISRQLRLRDLGGLIVLDFIDMRETKHKREVERTLKNHMKRDKARFKVGKISQFGIVEMSRQRIRPSIEHTSFATCPICRGKGQVPSVESIGIGFLRRLNLESLKGKVGSLKGYVTPDVADYILNRKRKELVDLESRRGLVISIEGDPELRPGESRIVPGQ
jgi:ribonuclease E